MLVDRPGCVFQPRRPAGGVVRPLVVCQLAGSATSAGPMLQRPCGGCGRPVLLAAAAVGRPVCAWCAARLSVFGTVA